jgi:hypothetical protein
MKPEDKDKLNACLEILDSTDLGLSMVWLWTWSTIDNILKDETYKAKVTMDDMWGTPVRSSGGRPGILSRVRGRATSGRSS